MARPYRVDTGRKTCDGCGKQFSRKPGRPITGFKKQKCCSKECSARARRKLVEIDCPQCGKAFKPESSRIKYCGRVCSASAHKGPVSVLGKPARYKKTNGALEHRSVMEGVIGRKLSRGETVHHKNGDKQDNSPENLELWYSAQPGGQRVDDLIEYIVKHHRCKLDSHLCNLLGERG